MHRSLPPIVLLLLATTYVAHAAPQQVVTACSRDSYQAYQSLADKLAPHEAIFRAMGVGVAGTESLNPLVKVQTDSKTTKLEPEKELDDPSCGLARAINFCSPHENSALSKQSGFFLGVSCALYRREHLVMFETGFTHMTFLIAYKKTGKHWILVQDWIVDPVVAFNLSADGTLLIDQVFDTDHEVWRWNGQAFSKEKEWRSVGFWNGKKYVRRNLNDKGDFTGATPDCSIAATRHAIALLAHESDPSCPGTNLSAMSEDERKNWTIARMRCEKSVDAQGAALFFSLAEWPSVGDEPWCFAWKIHDGDWRSLETGPDWQCLEAMDRHGITVSRKLLSVEHPIGCPATGPCVHHERWDWKGNDLKQIHTWYTSQYSRDPVIPCEHW